MHRQELLSQPRTPTLRIWLITLLNLNTPRAPAGWKIKLPQQDRLRAKGPPPGLHDGIVGNTQTLHTLATYRRLRQYHTPPHHLEFTLPSVIVIIQGDFSVFQSCSAVCRAECCAVCRAACRAECCAVCCAVCLGSHFRLCARALRRNVTKLQEYLTHYSALCSSQTSRGGGTIASRRPRT